MRDQQENSAQLHFLSRFVLASFVCLGAVHCSCACLNHQSNTNEHQFCSCVFVHIRGVSPFCLASFVCFVGSSLFVRIRACRLSARENFRRRLARRVLHSVLQAVAFFCASHPYHSPPRKAA